MNIVFEYIKYHWKAKGRNGIHSAFIQDLMDNCFQQKLDSTIQTKIDTLFRKLSKDQRVIEIEDHGAGSKKLSNLRKVSTIFTTSSSKGKYGRLFFHLAKHIQPTTVLELGTSLGIGTIHFSLGYPEAKITTIEGCSNTASIAKENLAQLDTKNVVLHQATFQDYFEENSDLKNVDIVFIDGHHEKNATLSYLEAIEPMIHDETLIILDDIRWNADMSELWNSLVNNPAYHTTIDLFRMGIISKRSKEVKEHFTLRF